MGESADLAKYTVAVDRATDILKARGIGADSEWFGNYVGGRRRQFAEQVGFVACTLNDPSKIIDWGAAPFVVGEALALLGHSVVAVDLAPHRFGRVDRLDCTVVEADLEGGQELPPELRNNDFAILSHVFEHLRMNLIGAVRTVRDSLSPGGALFLETPNLLSARGVVNLVRHRRAYSCAGSILHEWSKLDRIGHMGYIREYTDSEIKEVLEGCGFVVDTVSHHGFSTRTGAKGGGINYEN